MLNLNINRRKFVKGISATAGLAAFGGLGMNFTGIDRQWKVGLIGSGWYGKSDTLRLLQVAPVEVEAVCDVDQNMLNHAGQLISQRQKSGKVPKLYGDYRKMLDKHNLDIVIIGSPDHWHALHMIEAVKSGAHVYVQKPISADVVEGEAMLRAARKYNKVVQVGTQRRSTPHLIRAKEEIVDKGLLGKVSHVEVSCYTGGGGKMPPTEEVPDFFDYEMWTGPAPMLPYRGLPHIRWRAFMEYGNGIVGDMGIHMLDAARWMLGVGAPKKITSVGGTYVHKEGYGNRPDTQHAIFEFDELNFVWQQRRWGTPADPDYWWSFTLYGEKGKLQAGVRKADFTPVEGEPIHYDCVFEREEYPEDLTEERIELFAAPATRRHMQDFIRAIENGTKPIADIEQGHISSASCIMSNLSMQLGGRPLVYDWENRVVKGDKEATELLARSYRSPWNHPTFDNV
tara:strand:+ start:2873 stop:4234 length:1362 start_codon:yes stop_codon:yes gene_type:complete